MRIFGLLGRNINYSYSKEYFEKKFIKNNITNTQYLIFDVQNIKKIKDILNEKNNICGFNITIPYKEKIIDIIDIFSPEVIDIGAVNTIKIVSNKLIGFNTDIYGFEKSFLNKKKKYHKKAIILGTGGAAKAVIYVLNKFNIPYICVTHNKKKYIINNVILYKDISFEIIKKYQIIINCTPIGTYPNNKDYPKIPYNYLTKDYYLYDLIYNPSLTTFLKYGKKLGCTIQNGINMLYLQAEKSWKIWNENKYNISN